MKIGGFQPVTLSDYPGRVAAIIFTQGCNFRCRWCHNKSLISATRSEGSLIPVENLLAHLRHLRGRLDGVVVTGGEPTIQNDLPTFLSQIKEQDYHVKLDTNGSRPCMLGTLIDHHLVDFIAMDVKAPWEIYPHVANAILPSTCCRRAYRSLPTVVSTMSSARLPLRISLPASTDHCSNAAKKLTLLCSTVPNSNRIVASYGKTLRLPYAVYHLSFRPGSVAKRRHFPIVLKGQYHAYRKGKTGSRDPTRADQGDNLAR